LDVVEVVYRVYSIILF